MKIAITSPKCCNVSAGRLAELLGADYHQQPRNDFMGYDVLVNMGSSNPYIQSHNIINTPEQVRICVNKISTLKRVKHGVEWTKNPDLARQWITQGHWVVTRERETGTRSEGTTICLDLVSLEEQPAKFWTKYFPHTHEVRINVFDGKIISVYEKKEVEGIFKLTYLDIVGEHPQVQEMINSITEKIGIRLYGMDVLVNSEGNCALLEVNSGATLYEETEDILVKLLKREIKKHV